MSHTWVSIDGWREYVVCGRSDSLEHSVTVQLLKAKSPDGAGATRHGEPVTGLAFVQTSVRRDELDDGFMYVAASVTREGGPGPAIAFLVAEPSMRAKVRGFFARLKVRLLFWRNPEKEWKRAYDKLLAICREVRK